MALFRRKPSQRAIRAHLTQLLRAAGTFGSLVATSYAGWQTPAEARPAPGVKRPLKPEKVDADLRSRITAAIGAALRPHLGEQRRLLAGAGLGQGQSPNPDVKVWVQAHCEGLSGTYTGFSGDHITSSEAVTGALVTLVARLVVGEDGYLEKVWQGRVAPREQIVADLTHRAPFMDAYEASGFEEGLRAWIGSLLAP